MASILFHGFFDFITFNVEKRDKKARNIINNDKFRVKEKKDFFYIGNFTFKKIKDKYGFEAKSDKIEKKGIKSNNPEMRMETKPDVKLNENKDFFMKDLLSKEVLSAYYHKREKEEELRSFIARFIGKMNQIFIQ